MWTEVSSSVPHFLQMGSVHSHIICKCLLKVLCPVSRPITTLDCVLLKDNNRAPVARSGPEINSRACLCVLQGHTDVPDTHNTDVPDTHNKDVPDTHNTDVPNTYNTDVADTHNTGVPDTHNTDVPDTHNTGIPDTHNTDVHDTHYHSAIKLSFRYSLSILPHKTTCLVIRGSVHVSGNCDAI
jgi:hypothetical protein